VPSAPLATVTKHDASAAPFVRDAMEGFLNIHPAMSQSINPAHSAFETICYLCGCFLAGFQVKGGTITIELGRENTHESSFITRDTASERCRSPFGDYDYDWYKSRVKGVAALPNHQNSAVQYWGFERGYGTEIHPDEPEDRIAYCQECCLRMSLNQALSENSVRRLDLWLAIRDCAVEAVCLTNALHLSLAMLIDLVNAEQIDQLGVFAGSENFSSPPVLPFWLNRRTPTSITYPFSERTNSYEYE
jgi:hypothetical protein